MNDKNSLFGKISILSRSSHLRGVLRQALRPRAQGRVAQDTSEVSLVRILNLWLPVVLWCGLLFYLSSIPNLKAAENPFWDEILRGGLHFVFYVILYLLFFRALNFQRKKKLFAWPLILAFLYGLSDEIHQSFVPTRTFQLRDLLINFLGVSFGGLGRRLTREFNCGRLSNSL